MSRGNAGSLRRFFGWGSAHEGAHHWRAQRIGALALIPLTLWLVGALVLLPDYSFATLQDWAATPWRAVLLALLLLCMAWHSQLGVQVVIEDYVHGAAMQSLSLWLNAVLHLLVAAAGVIALASIAFGD